MRNTTQLPPEEMFIGLRKRKYACVYSRGFALALVGVCVYMRAYVRTDYAKTYVVNGRSNVSVHEWPNKAIVNILRSIVRHWIVSRLCV